MKEAALLLLALAVNALIVALALFIAFVAFIAVRGVVNYMVDSITALFGRGRGQRSPRP